MSIINYQQQQQKNYPNDIALPNRKSFDGMNEWTNPNWYWHAGKACIGFDIFNIKWIQLEFFSLLKTFCFFSKFYHLKNWFIKNPPNRKLSIMKCMIFNFTIYQKNEKRKFLRFWSNPYSIRFFRYLHFVIQFKSYIWSSLSRVYSQNAM